MGSSTEMDFGGLTYVVKDIKVGATAPGQAGTSLASTELVVLDGASSANTGTNKAVITGTSGAITVAGVATFDATPVFSTTSTFTGAPTFNADPVIGAGKTINLDSAPASLTSNAVTLTKFAGVITTESLTTAHTATATFVITLVGVAAGDLAFVTMAGGTNSAGIVGTPNAVTSTNTITVTIKNEALTTNAFNGTLIFNLWVLKA
jgi:hypothetical protein